MIPPPTRPLPPPPSVPHPPPPSTLLTSYKLSGGGNGGGGSYPSFSDSGIVADSSLTNLYHRSTTTGAPYPLMDVSMHHHQQLAAGHYHHPQLQKTPVKGRFERGGYAKICGSSPVTDHLNKTGQIQSVPPWFVCSDKKSDGKVCVQYVSVYQ